MVWLVKNGIFFADAQSLHTVLLLENIISYSKHMFLKAKAINLHLFDQTYFIEKHAHPTS